jgi:hypothetical protein
MSGLPGGIHIGHTSDNSDNCTFPARGLGVHLDNRVNSMCPCFPIFAQQPPIDVYPFHPMQNGHGYVYILYDLLQAVLLLSVLKACPGGGEGQGQGGEKCNNC